ncbi:hypothetical protein CAP35_12255 [Chitinophagaceae bacterium IBVUCB1]|nr:hypothetical protein CAP35_12255 [Chitinophagaceae bacterium IBVUCB1]
MKGKFEDAAYYGNFEANLFFKISHNDFSCIYKEVIDDFKPNLINQSSLDIHTNTIQFNHNIQATLLDENIITKIILNNKVENIIIDYHNEHCLIQHNYKTKHSRNATGHTIINNYYNSKSDVVLILGFELSLDVNLFTKSLNDNINGFSPIIKIEKTNHQYVVSKFNFNTKTLTQQEEIVNSYLHLIKLSDY